MKHEALEGLPKTLVTTPISRRHLLNGLAASAVFAVFPVLRVGGPNLAHAQASSSNVNASSEFTGEALYKTLWLSKYSGNDRTRQLMSVILLQGIYRQTPNIDPLDAVEVVKEFQRRYDQEVTRGEGAEYQKSKSETDNYQLAIQVFAKLPHPVASQVGGIADLVSKKFIFDPIKQQWEAVNQLTAVQQQFNSFQAVHDFEQEALTRMVTAKNPKFQTALDVIQANTLNTSIKVLDAAAIIASNPELQIPVLLKELIKSGESLNVSVEDLRALMQKKLDELKAMMTDQTAFLKALDAKQEAIRAWTEAEDERRRDEAAEQLKREQYQLVLDGAKSTVFLLATLVGVADQKAAKEITVIGNAAIQIGDSLKTFLANVARFGGNQLALGMSTAILTGNIVGAVMNIVSLFTGSGQPPLEEQVAQLREEMHDRFDRIDASLNQIYETILSSFDLVGRDLTEVQQQLAALELKLGTLGRNLLQSLQTLGRRPLVEAINGAIGYEERNQGRLMPSEKFIDYENTFFTWATINAKDELEQDTDGRSYEDIDLLEELGRPLEDNVMYLSTFLTKRGIPSFASTRLAHPTVWAMSSRAYAELRYEWPDYAERIAASRNDRVQQVGTELQSALRRISVKAETPTGPTPNKELFDALLGNYEQKSLRLQGPLVEAETAVVATLRETGKQVANNFDLWGGPYQRISYDPWRDSDPQISPAPPSNLAGFIPPPYLIDDYLRITTLGRLKVIYQGGWTDLRPNFLAASWTGKPTVRITVTYPWQRRGVNAFQIFTRYVVGPEWTWPTAYWVNRGIYLDPFTTYPWKEDPIVLQTYWTGPHGNLKATFESGGSQELLPDPLASSKQQFLSDVSAQVCQRLKVTQALVYQKVFSALELSGDPIRSAAVILSGAKALLRSFIELGMPQALGADDFLRALLYGAESGSQSLLDDTQVSEKYATALSAAHGCHVSLRSFNYPIRLVRHRDDLADLTEITTELDRQDATFKIVPGFEGTNTVAFESVNSSGTYLSHQDAHRLKLKVFSDDAFKAHASFTMVAGLADAKNGVSFKSYSHPDRYIRHRESQMWVEPGSTDLFRRDATFMMEIKNPRVLIKEDADWRIDALGGALTGYLDQIGRGEYSEYQPLISTTLLRARVIDAVIENADLKPPMVTSTTPVRTARATTNVTATFSEAMDKATVEAPGTFTLKKKGSTTPLRATVTYDPATKKATLNPTNNLRSGATYIAQVSTAATDSAGNALDQNPATVGNQLKRWSFKVT